MRRVGERGSNLIGVLERVPTRRLVVLGEAGSGKTMLLIQLVLDLVARRAPGDPVPLLIPLASFDPDRHTFHSWLEAQLLRDHRSLLSTTTASGVSRAQALLAAGPRRPGRGSFRSGAAGRGRVCR